MAPPPRAARLAAIFLFVLAFAGASWALDAAVGTGTGLFWVLFLEKPVALAMSLLALSGALAAPMVWSWLSVALHAAAVGLLHAADALMPVVAVWLALHLLVALAFTHAHRTRPHPS